MKENNALNGQPGPLETKSPLDKDPFWVYYPDSSIRRWLERLYKKEELSELLRRNSEVMGLTGGWCKITPGEDLSRTTPSPNAKEKEGVNVAP